MFVRFISRYFGTMIDNDYFVFQIINDIFKSVINYVNILDNIWYVNMLNVPNLQFYYELIIYLSYRIVDIPNTQFKV